MQFKVSPHSHPESSLSGSTVESMIDRAVLLGRTSFAYTDIAYMTSLLRGYEYAKEKNIKFIAGLEVFFKDDNCDLIKKTSAEKASYFTITLYATNQKQLEKLSEISSRDSDKKIKYYGKYYPTINWEILKDAASNGLIAVSGGVHDLVGKHIATNTPEVGEKVFLRLKEYFGKNYYLSIVGNEVSKSWASLVYIKYKDGTEDVVFSNSNVSTNAARSAKAIELVTKSSKHSEVKSVQKGLSTDTFAKPKKISSASLEEGFLPLPVGDVQEKINKFFYFLSKKHYSKLLYSDYAFYSEPEDKIVQDIRLSQDNIKEHTKRHMQSTEDALAYLESKMPFLKKEEKEELFKNNEEWANTFQDFNLEYEYRLPKVPDGKTSLQVCLDQIKKLGRLPKDSKEYVDRLKHEISVLANNGKIDLTPYFLPIKDVLDFYRENGRLTGPARGSAGGSLFLYLMGITQIDPIKYGLSFERFQSLDRILAGDNPDVDVDLVCREPLVGPDGASGFLYTKWGDRAAQISTRIQMRLKSSIKDVERYLTGKVSKETERISKALPMPPQGIEDKNFVFGFEDDGTHVLGLIETNKDLQKYAELNPKSWNFVQKCLGISRQHSKHACFALDTLVDSNGEVLPIQEAKFSIKDPITTWSSGVRKTILVSFNNGITIRCTPDHKFIVGGESIEAKDLVGKVVEYVPFSKTHGNNKLPKNLLFSLGWGLNDGTFHVDRPSSCFHFTPEKDDEGKKIVQQYLEENKIKTWSGRDDELYCGKTGLSELFFESKRNSIQRLPKYFWKLDLNSQCVFMQGLFSANGYVLKTRKRVGIKIASRLLANDIAVWLHSLDIKTSAIFFKPSYTNAYGRTFKNNGSVDLTISGDSSRNMFFKLVGFVQKYKQERLKEVISIKKLKIHTKDVRGS